MTKVRFVAPILMTETRYTLPYIWHRITDTNKEADLKRMWNNFDRWLSNNPDKILTYKGKTP